MINWGPRFNYSRIYDYNGVLTDEDINLNVQAQFTRNMNINGSVTGGMERYGGIDFDRRRFSLGGGINTSRRISFGGFMNIGKQIRYIEDAVSRRRPERQPLHHASPAVAAPVADRHQHQPLRGPRDRLAKCST